MSKRNSLSLHRLIVLCLLTALPASLHADVAAEKLVLATYKLAGEGSTATCLVVSHEGKDGGVDRFIITANHVFSQMRGDSCHLISREEQKNGTYERKKIKLMIRNDDEALWKKHKKHDLAVMRLPDSVEVNALPFDCLMTEAMLKKVYTGDTVHLAVFPEHTEANGAGFPILRSGSIASFPLVPIKHHALFLIDTTTWSGDSGGPVIHKSLRSDEGSPLVIGLVIAKKSITDTVKDSRYVERTTHYPLDISEALHAVFARGMIIEYNE